MKEFDLRTYLAKNPLMEKKEDSKKGNKEEQKRMEGSIRDNEIHIDKLNKDIKADRKKLSKLKKDEPKDVSKKVSKKDVSEMKAQGYDDREDESLGARTGAEKGKKQSMKDRRDDSYGKFGKRDAEKRGKNKINKEEMSKSYSEDGDMKKEEMSRSYSEDGDMKKEEMSRSYSEDGDTAMDKRAKTIRDREKAQIERDARRSLKKEQSNSNSNYGSNNGSNENSNANPGTYSGLEKFMAETKDLKLTKEGLKDMIREKITSILNEAEEDNVDVNVEKDVDIDVKDKVKVDDESSKSEMEIDGEIAGASSDEAAVLSLLTKSQSLIPSLGGDQLQQDKMVQQINNTITMFAREYLAQSPK